MPVIKSLNTMMVQSGDLNHHSIIFDLAIAIDEPRNPLTAAAFLFLVNTGFPGQAREG